MKKEGKTCDLTWEFENKKVCSLKCKHCVKYKDRIQNIPKFSDSWINGTRKVKKDSLIKHINSKMHQEASKLYKKEELGPTKFVEDVVEKTPIGKGLSRMNRKDQEALNISFNSAYYLGKRERLFTDLSIPVESAGEEWSEEIQ